MASDVRVRVVPDPTRAGELAGGALTERLADRIQELAGALARIAKDFRAQLDSSIEGDQSGDWGLREVSLTFSLQLEAGTGVIVANAKGSAGFEAELTWERRDGKL